MQQSQQLLPFRFQEVFKLTNLGLSPDLFKFGNLSFESQKYICVKDGPQCVIIDTSQNFKMDRKDMKADAIIMHRERNIIAVRAKNGANTVIQVYDMVAGPPALKQCEVADDVVYWKWISIDKIGVVGKRSVYHIDITKKDEPARKMFDRDAKLENCQIMAYETDAAGNWCSLIGLYSNDQKSINSQMQLFSVEKGVSQMLEGYASCFTELPLSDNNPSYKNSVFCFCEKKASEQQHHLHIMEIGNPAPGNTMKFKVKVDIMMAADAPGDFPILMQAAPKYGLLFMITKMGYLFLFETFKGSLVYRQRITDQLVFVSVRNAATDGMICISKAGQVLAINIEENNLVKYVMGAQHIQDNRNVAARMAQRYSLPGADDIFMAQFNTCIASGDYAGAARAARDAPGTLLRNSETIQKFKNLPPSGQGPQPILVYFSTLLETTKLNEIESVELARPVLQQGKYSLIEDWVSKDKLTMSDALGDVIRQYNPQMALKVYQNSGSPDKVIMGLVETQQFDKIVPYCQQTNYKPDFMKILHGIIPQNSQAALKLAQMISVRDASGQPKTAFEPIVQVFLEYGKVQETTAFLLEALKGNLSHEGHLQTKLFQINLQNNPNVAEGIFQLNMCTHFDKQEVAKMCETVGMYGRALQNYQNVEDAKRVMLNSHNITPDIMIEFFGRLEEDDALACLHRLLESNRQNGQLCAEIAVKYAAKIDAKKSIQILESFGSNDALLYFLCNVLPHTQDPDIYFKYIECCARLSRFGDVEKVIKETNYYDPVKVRDFLMEGKFSDPRPLIYLCDMHNFIEDLTKYLYTTKQQRCIEVYLFKVNSSSAPKVLGTLLNIDCDETYIRALLKSIKVTPIPELVEEFENRGKLRMLTQWLEDRFAERSQEPALHNALAKIYIDSGEKDPREFLIKNQFYDSKVIGKYCENLNPDLAFTAYKRAWGKCDDELIEVTNKAYLFRAQARYLVERQEPSLWAKVLDPENPNRQNVVDQVVQTALPECKNVDEVSITVKAFIDAKLPEHLIELLERIVLHSSDFSENKSLQNLLILTAIRSYPTRVMDYINKLDNYDGPKLAAMAQEDDHMLYDEAILTMIDHSPSAFSHHTFTANIIKVSNHDLYYKAFIFYLEEEPMLLVELMQLLASKIDLTKTVQVMKNSGHIALIQPFLKNVQQMNYNAVNEALNKIYLENEDFEGLSHSIRDFDSINSINLAYELENHELLECRRIAALLYRKNKRYQQSIAISKKDGAYQDAMETVAESGDSSLAEDLLRFVMSMEDKELIATMLYTCYDLVKPDVALEIGWRCELQEFIMPYFVQFVKDLSTRVEKVQKSTDDIKKKEDDKAQEEANRPLDMNLNMEYMFPGMDPQNNGIAAIMPAAGSMGAGAMGAGFQTQQPVGGMGGMGMQGFGTQQPNMGMGGGMQTNVGGGMNNMGGLNF